MTFQDLQPVYMREAQRVWEKHEQPVDLLTILEQNFVQEPRWNMACARSQERKRTLSRSATGSYEGVPAVLRHRRASLKVVRTEALRAGFKECWQKSDYATIIQMAKRVPEAVIQEDPALLMYYDNALMRKGE